MCSDGTSYIAYKQYCRCIHVKPSLCHYPCIYVYSCIDFVLHLLSKMIKIDFKTISKGR